MRFLNNGKGGGTDTSDATATADDIRIGKDAYGASGKLNGTLDFTGFNDYNDCFELSNNILRW